MKSPRLVVLLCLAALPAWAQDLVPADPPSSLASLTGAPAKAVARGRDFEGGRLYQGSWTEQQKGRLRRTFTLEVERAGDYFIGAHALASNAVPADARAAAGRDFPLQRIDVYLDERHLGELELVKNGWQASRIQGKGPLYFSAGSHRLSFESDGPLYPEVDAVKLAAREDGARFDTARYDEYVTGLKRLGEQHLGQTKKAELVPPAQGAPVEQGSIAGAASTDAITWQVTPYSLANPLGNHGHMMRVPVVYTYYRKLTLSFGQSVTFNTAPIAGQDYYAVDPVMYLFCSTDNTVAWSNDDDIGRHPRIAVTIPKTCDYYLVLRAFSTYYAGTPQGSQGVVNVYLNGSLLQADAPVSGYITSVGTSNTGTLNYFTAYSTGSPMLWLSTAGSLSPLRFYGGRYWYVSPMDHNWFDDARFRIVKNTTSFMDLHLMVSAEGAWWVYWGNADLYGSVRQVTSTPLNSFPNLKVNDGMQSAPSAKTYNCATWAGGQTHAWFWGCYTPTRTTTEPKTDCYAFGYAGSWMTWDAYFGNTPPRYTGAMTYTRDLADAVNGEVALWSKSQYIQDVTHFSLRRTGNQHPHGYDWESKPGEQERIFHPRDALVSTDYGSIIAYYRDAAKDPYTPWPLAPGVSAAARPPSLSMEQSVALGLTAVQRVALEREESEQLDALSAAAAKHRPVLDRLVGDWLARVDSEALSHQSELAIFFEQREYTRLEAWARRHPDAALPYLMEKLVQSEDEGRETTLLAVLFAHLAHERHAPLMEEVKQAWRLSSYTQDGAYLAPSPVADTKRYIRRILQQQAGVRGERLVAGAAPWEDSHERFSVSPNPMVDASRLRFRVDAPAAVSLALYDAQGHLVRPLASGDYDAGSHAVTLSREGLLPGVYAVRLTVGDQVLTRRVALY